MTEGLHLIQHPVHLRHHVFTVHTDGSVGAIPQSDVENSTALQAQLTCWDEFVCVCDHLSDVYTWPSLRTSVKLIFSPENILSLASSTPRDFACWRDKRPVTTHTHTSYLTCGWTIRVSMCENMTQPEQEARAATFQHQQNNSSAQT